MAMDPRTPRQYLDRRWSALDNEYSTWRSHHREINDYLTPRSGRFETSETNNGRKKHNNIYDSTATRAHRILAAGLMSGATSPARPWFRLATGDRDLMKYDPVKLWMNHATRGMMQIFAGSNTYRVIHTMYEDIGAFATSGAVLMDDFEDVIRLYPSAMGEFRLAHNERLQVDTYYRKFAKNVGSLVGEFGYKNCSATTKSLYDSGEYDKWITVIHAIEPRRERDIYKGGAKNMPFKSCYYEEGSEETQFLRESGFKRFRGLAPRWAVTGTDVYGSNCPGMEALGDIKQLQHEQLRKAEGIDHMTKPALQVPSNLKNREVDRLPGGTTYYDGAQPGAGVRRLFDVNLDLNALREDIVDVRSRINDTFYVDLFLMLSNIEDHRMTATEVAERHEEKLLMLGPVLERLHNELLEPLVDMTFERMIEAGLVPPPPEELQGQPLNIEFVSMLAQAQRAVSTNSVDRYVARMGEIAAFKPGVLDNFDEDHWADAYADMLGIDPEFIVSDDKVALVRDAKQKAAQQQQQVAAAESMSKSASNLGKTPTDGKNALTDVIQMFSGYTTPQGL